MIGSTLQPLLASRDNPMRARLLSGMSDPFDRQHASVVSHMQDQLGKRECHQPVGTVRALAISLQFFPMLIQSYVNTTELVAQIIETYFPNEFQERRELHEKENVQR